MSYPYYPQQQQQQQQQGYGQQQFSNVPPPPSGHGAFPGAPTGPPGSSYPAPPPSGMGNYPAPPSQGPGGYPAPPQSFGNYPAQQAGPPQSQYGQGPLQQALYSSAPAPPTSNFGQPPMPPASSFGGTGGFSSPAGNIPPPSGSGMPAPAPKANVQFFSMAGGTPTPSAATTGGPPGSQWGGGAPPGGPPSGGPPTGAPLPPLSQPGAPQFYAAPGGPSQIPSPGVMTPGAYGAGMPPPGSQFGQPPQADYGNPQYGGAPHSAMPAAFESMGNLAQAAMGMAGGNTPGQLQGTAGGPGAGPGQAEAAGGPLPTLQEIDLSIQCNPKFLRATVGRLHVSQATANTSRIPLGVICKPMADDVGTKNDMIDVVDFGSTGIIRCKRCRTYINPFVSWSDNGRRWRCNICGMLNDVPTTYFSHLDSNGQRRDRDQRPELSKCSVEFVAPGDYMVRPPQPPVYFFVIDVSAPSVQSGMLQSCVTAIKESLDQLPGAPRTQIGFITFDSSVHFYNLKSSLSSPQMLVVSDVSDIILPLPEDLLVNLQESRTVVDNLLDSLPSTFARTNATNTSTGPALLAARRVIQHVGGKLLLFQSSLPSMGEGTLKPRDNPRILGTDKEHTLLNVEDAWYKNCGIEFSRLQVAVDTFLFSGQYTDVATLSVLSKYSAGSCYYYPGFFGPRDGAKFESELTHCLTRATGFEAVMRVRATRGFRITNFYGNYFVRGTDLLALPNVSPDTTFAFDLAYDESMLSAQAITVQAALLYTSSNGERRIRIHTTVLPVTQALPEVVDSIDIDAMVNLLSKQAVDIAQKTGFDNARQRVHQITVEMLRGCKSQPAGHGYGPGQYQQHQQEVAIPLTLQLLPLYSMSMQKSLALRGGAEVRIDERAFYQQLVFNMDVDSSRVFVYPRMFSLHDLPDDAGVPSEVGEDEIPTAGPFHIRLPQILNLTHERLASDGVFLLENGYDLFMWIGRNASQAVLSTLFGVQSLDGVDPGTLAIQPDNSDYSSRVHAVVVALRADRERFMNLHFIREGDGHAEAFFARYLVEDRAHFPGGAMSYTEYHGYVSRQVSGLPG